MWPRPRRTWRGGNFHLLSHSIESFNVATSQEDVERRKLKSCQWRRIVGFNVATSQEDVERQRASPHPMPPEQLQCGHVPGGRGELGLSTMVFLAKDGLQCGHVPGGRGEEIGFGRS